MLQHVGHLDGETSFILREQYETWIYSIIGSICIGLSGIFPLLVIPIESGPALKHGEPAKNLRLMLSFAVGSLLGDVFLHLLPEVWSHLDRDSHADLSKCGLWVIFGLLAFMIIEKLMAEDDDDESESCADSSSEDDANISSNGKRSISNSSSTPSISKSKNAKTNTHQSNNGKVSHRKVHKSEADNNDKAQSKSKNGVQSKKVAKGHTDGHSNKPVKNNNKNNNKSDRIKVSGYLNLIANVVDNFTHGLAVAAAFCISTKVGLMTTMAILLHEIPHEVGDFAILLRSGFDRWKAAKAQLLTACGGVIGALTALLLESSISGGKALWILPFTSGGFLYIALVTVVPELVQEKNCRESLKQVSCICLGVFSMMFVTILCD